MRERLAYLHIPKSAGTSIRASLEERFDADDTAPWSFDRYLFGPFTEHERISEPIMSEPAEALADYRFATGHWALPTLLVAFDPADVATVLREPRSRLLSHYSFWRTWPEWMHDLWDPYDAARHAQQPLADYLGDPAVAHQTDNLTTRLLLGRHDLVPVDGFIAAEHVEQLTAEACAAVDGLGRVDVVERGADMLANLGDYLGFEVRDERLNTTAEWDGPSVDADDITERRSLELVTARSAIDLAVWDHVYALFEKSPAARRGVADAAFARTVGRLALEGERQRAHENSPVGVKLAALVHRGPRAVIDRVRVAIRRGA